MEGATAGGKDIFDGCSRIRCVIAGGGTGGHLFPGIAVARELERRSEEAEILFVVGRRPMESEILERHGYKVSFIDIEGLKGRGWFKGFSVVLRLPKGMFQSFRILSRFSPSFVLGMGGYSSGPLCLAARIMGVPTAIHEQNSFPGLTNRLLSRVADRIFISFEESRAYFKGGELFLTGNPVRDEIFQSREMGERESGKFVVLVVGGSQGAHGVNEAFLEALSIMKRRGVSPDVIHQTGRVDYKKVAAAYRELGLKGEVAPFFQDMAHAYAQADLVVGRAGASTIFELAALGKPAILVPYPHAANQHQETNALSLVRAGGAEMVLQSELTGEVLADLLMKYMGDRAALREMGRRSRSMGRPEAARRIVDHLFNLTGLCRDSEKQDMST